MRYDVYGAGIRLSSGGVEPQRQMSKLLNGTECPEPDEKRGSTKRPCKSMFGCVEADTFGPADAALGRLVGRQAQGFDAAAAADMLFEDGIDILATLNPVPHAGWIYDDAGPLLAAIKTTRHVDARMRNSSLLEPNLHVISQCLRAASSAGPTRMSIRPTVAADKDMDIEKRRRVRRGRGGRRSFHRAMPLV